MMHGPKEGGEPCPLGDAVLLISSIHPIKNLKKGAHLNPVPECVNGIAVQDIVVDFFSVIKKRNHQHFIITIQQQQTLH